MCLVAYQMKLEVYQDSRDKSKIQCIAYCSLTKNKLHIDNKRLFIQNNNNIPITLAVENLKCSLGHDKDVVIFSYLLVSFLN